MSFHKIFTSKIGVNMSLFLGDKVPTKVSYRIVRYFADKFSMLKNNPFVSAIRINQWIIHGEQLSSYELDEITKKVFRHAARCQIDLMKNIKNHKALTDLSPLTKKSRELIAQSKSDRDGAFIVAPHLSNFDLLLRTLAFSGLHGQLLTYGTPTGGYEIQNEIRSGTKLEITPLRDESVHKQAIKRMRSGGFAITAVDRAIRKKTRKVNFFGLPSPLPTGHIRMALEADVPIIVAAAQFRDDKKYHLLLSDPIPMKRYSHPGDEIRKNAETILKVISDFIMQAPEQWLMFYPAWADADARVP